MKYYSIFSAEGELVRYGYCQDDDFDLQQVGNTEFIVEGEYLNSYRNTDGVITSYTAEQLERKSNIPNFIAKWDNISMSWVDLRSLPEVKRFLLERIKSIRDQKIYGGFIWDNSTFDSDETAQSRILGLYVSSQQTTYVPTMWRLADNSWRELSTQDVLGVWDALQSHVRSQFVIFAQLEAQILAATTKEEVEAVAWPNI